MQTVTNKKISKQSNWAAANYKFIKKITIQHFWPNSTLHVGRPTDRREPQLFWLVQYD